MEHDDRELIELFLEETGERLQEIEPALVELEQAASETERERLLNQIFRHLHSTKGSAGYLGLDDLVALVHAAEQLADALRGGAPLHAVHIDLLLQATATVKAYLAALSTSGDTPAGLDGLTAALQQAAAVAAGAGQTLGEQPAIGQPMTSGTPSETGGESDSRGAGDTDLASSTVRVPIHVLDRLGRLAEEMLVTRNRITTLAADLQDMELTGAAKKLSLMVTELQDIAELTRLQPISHLFSQMPRVVRDAARLTGKDVELVLVGGQLEVDRRILQELRDALVHLLRNAVDHGIESPERRIAAGKPSRGRITVRAFREGSNLILEVSDDGAGIDVEAVRAKAVERGLVSPREVASLGEDEVASLLLRPGFSTRERVTELSGRGVGLDVVGVRMQELGGHLAIRSSAGQGTTVRLTVPTSVSVVHTLVFTARGYLLGIPYDVVQEIVLIDRAQVERYGEQDVFRLRDQLVPLFTLDRWPDRCRGEAQRDRHYVLVLRGGQTLAGLLCDGIARFEELIVKPVANLMRGVESVSGLATLGTGEIVLILEAERILAEAGLAAARLARDEAREAQATRTGTAAEAAREVLDELSERMVLLRGFGTQRYALPVRLVSRIVRFDLDELVAIGERLYLCQERRLVPLIDVDRALGFDDGERRRSGIAVLLHADSFDVGLLASGVVRIGNVTARPEPSDRPGVTGLLTLPDHVYLLLDVPALVHGQLQRLVSAYSDGAVVNGKRALIVEDSAFYRDALEATLRRAGFVVLSAGSVSEALELLAHDPEIALVITDYMLPGQSGLDLVQAVRSGGMGIRMDVPIVVLSQFLRERDRDGSLAERLYAAGADAVFAKFDELEQSELLERFRALVGEAGGDGARCEGVGEDEERAHLLAITLGGEVYGIPVDRVREITTLDGVTPTPLDQEGFLGLANIRGEIVPVFELGGVLRRPVQSGRTAVDVVTLTASGPLVLRGESIRGTVTLPVRELRVPAGKLGALSDLVPAVATLPDCLLQVVELDRLADVCLGRR